MTRKEISRRVFVKGSLFGLVASGLALSGCGDSSQFEFTSFGPEPVVGGRQFQVLQSALLQFAPDGSVFSLDFDDHTVARLDSSGAVLWEVGGLNDGTGLFNFPVALVASRDGRIFVADRGNGEIDVLDSDGNPIAVIGVGQLLSARALAIDLDRGLLYVCDGPAHQVLVFELDGTFVRNLGQFGTDSGSGLNFPSGVAVASNGDVHIVDSGNATVQVHGSDGAFLREYGARGSDLGQFNVPRAIVLDSQGRSLVADGITGFITVFDIDGTPLERFVPAGPNGPIHPLYMSMSPTGVLVVSGPPTLVAV